MKRITALAISVIMMCSALWGCGKKEEVKLHDYEAIVNGEPFKLTYSLEKNDGGVFSEEEAAEIDKSVSGALTKAMFLFSDTNSAGVGEINKSVDAVLDCSKELLDLIEYTYRLSSLTSGRYQPVFGCVTGLYKNGGDITEEALAEALKHTGMSLITIEDNNIRKADREAKLDYDSISAGYALKDATAVLSVKGVSYAVLTYKNTVVSVGHIDPKEAVDVAVYLSDNKESYSGVLSFNNSVVTTCNKNDFVIDNRTGKRVESKHDTVIVMCDDGILSNVLAPIIYSMTKDEIQNLYDSKVLRFEAVVVDADGEFYKTSDAVKYEKNTPAD